MCRQTRVWFSPPAKLHREAACHYPILSVFDAFVRRRMRTLKAKATHLALGRALSNLFHLLPLKITRVSLTLGV